MTLNLTIQKTAHTDFTPRITVIGVGGGGTNAVNNMIALNLPGVDFVVANTDAQQLLLSKAERRIQLGPHITQGNGAGGRPEVGRASAEEAADDLARHLDEAHMVFITAGMGGGTGTGAAPVIARMARERGILTVGVVTKPFAFEGKRRMKAAEEGIADLQNFVDTLIVIPNQNLFKVANERTGWKEAFQMADHVLYMGVRGVTDLMVVPGLVNLDYADIRSVMAEMGKAMMGTGEADGEERALRAAEAAISNPLLEDTNMKGARGLLINITGGSDLTLFEVDQAANRIREEVDEDANIMFGTAIDEELNGRIRISVVATGIDTAMAAQAERPRLVAVGGGHAVADATAPAMAAQTGQQPATPAEVPSQADIAAQMAQPQGGYPHHAQPHSGQPHSAQPHPVQQLHPAQMPQQQPQQPAAQHHGAQPGGAQHGAVRAPISAQAPLYPREQPARPTEPAKRPSLFNRMTQGLRAAAQAQAPRPVQPTEPPMPSQAPSHNAAPVYAPQQPQQAQPQHPQAHAQQAYPQQGQAQPMRAEHAPGHGAPGQGASGHAASGQMHFRGSHDDHRASVRQMQTEDIGLDIPAFLRRQHS